MWNLTYARAVQLVATAAAATIMLGGCHTTTTSAPVRSVSARSMTPAPSAAAAGAASVQLIQEPDAGMDALYRLINSARSTLDMTMYALADRTAENDLVAAARRGVTVRVLLNADYGGKVTNGAAYRILSAGGVMARWAPSNVIFHEKAFVADGHTLAVGTGNLQSRYYPTGVDAWVVTTSPTQAAAVESTFATDFASGSSDSASAAAASGGLVWSPGATAALTGAIAAARTSVWFSSEELSDHPVIAALEAAGRRGVDCRILMTDDPKWHTAFGQLAAAGCHVRIYSATADRYIHEKQILTDPGQPSAAALIGSQNATVTSLGRNRELSVQLTDQAVIGAAAATYSKLYGAAAPA